MNTESWKKVSLNIIDELRFRRTLTIVEHARGKFHAEAEAFVSPDTDVHESWTVDVIAFIPESDFVRFNLDHPNLFTDVAFAAIKEITHEIRSSHAS